MDENSFRAFPVPPSSEIHQSCADGVREERTMIDTTVSRSGLLGSPSFPGADREAVAQFPKPRRRRLDRESGQAIEKLGHAIEYLVDEFALDCLNPAERTGDSAQARMDAIELLMAFNRQIYLNCPQIPTFSDRLRKLLGLQGA